MFESLTRSFDAVFKKLRSRGKLTDNNISSGLDDIRLALLEADVSYKVVREFVEKVREEAVGQQVIKSVSPAQQIVKIVHDELEALMGPPDSRFYYSSSGPTVVMLAGLQGSGKTTTAGKLARSLAKKGRHPLLVAADIQRPAAIDQLKVLGEQLELPVFTQAKTTPPEICERSVAYASQNELDTIVMDTAGRLHIDNALMAELKEIASRVTPHEILLVCDAMTGQDAVNSAKEFNSQLALSGVILTKLDGDARGGAALSIKAVTGKPIKYVGVGEKLDDLEEFHPDRMANRILGMGDVVSLVEKAEAAMDEEKALQLEKKIKDNKLTLEDFLDQLEQIEKMGPLQDLLGMIPGMSRVPEGFEVDDRQLHRIKAIIQSMTPQERSHPEVIQRSRRARIAGGSGTEVQDVNMLLKQFKQTKKMMKRFGKTGFPNFGL